MNKDFETEGFIFLRQIVDSYIEQGWSKDGILWEIIFTIMGFRECVADRHGEFSTCEKIICETENIITNNPSMKSLKFYNSI